MLDDDFLSNKCMDRVATIAMATKSCLIVIWDVAFIEAGAGADMLVWMWGRFAEIV